LWPHEGVREPSRAFQGWLAANVQTDFIPPLEQPQPVIPFPTACLTIACSERRGLVGVPVRSGPAAPGGAARFVPPGGAVGAPGPRSKANLAGHKPHPTLLAPNQLMVVLPEKGPPQSQDRSAGHSSFVESGCGTRRTSQVPVSHEYRGRRPPLTCRVSCVSSPSNVGILLCRPFWPRPVLGFLFGPCISVSMELRGKKVKGPCCS